MCFVWISEQTATIPLHSINLLVFITETECVYRAVRNGISKGNFISYLDNLDIISNYLKKGTEEKSRSLLPSTYRRLKHKITL
jgi:hypothetical protein